MGYKLKEEVALALRKKYKKGYIASIVGLSDAYVSQIFHRKITIPKRLAYSFSKAINSEYEIKDLFELVNKN